MHEYTPASIHFNISTIISIYQRLFQYIDDSTRNIDLSTNYDIAERAYTPQYLDDMHEVAEWK